MSNLKKTKDVNIGDRVFHHLMWFGAAALVLLLLAIVYELFDYAMPVVEKFGASFFITDQWDPQNDDYGALAFAYGTLVSSLLALLLAAPVSIGVAAFLTELAPLKLGKALGFLVEMLAAIPSVVYGLWGIFFLAPWLRATVQPFLGDWFGFLPLFQGPPFGVGMLCAGVILAIMITPTISSVCREVFQAVSYSQREAALALGSTRWEMICLAVLKSSKSGIIGAMLLGLGRALGETMAVAMVIGNRNDIAASLFAPGQTMASLIANEYNEAGGLQLSALAAVGLALFFVSLITNSIARLVAWGIGTKGARA